jgi:hypothetical protein
VAAVIRRRISEAFALAAVAFVLTPQPAGAADASTVVPLRDHRLSEISGIARGLRSPGVFYLQNDSGDSARFFAVDGHTGRVRAVYVVPGATNVDWEDIAVAPDGAGTPSVWLGDIGDNRADRSEVRVYRVDEPRVRMTRYDVHVHTEPPDVWRLRYPGGPVNAESLAVAPDGRGYIVTKNGSGHSICYELPRRPDPARVQVLRRIGAIRIPARGASFVPAPLQRMVTGAAISPDGTVLAMRTYTDAFLWHIDDGDVAAALRFAPRRVELPLELQGEGIGFDGDRLVIDSEQFPSAVLAVPLPRAFRSDVPPPRPTDVTPGSAGPTTPNPSASGPGTSSAPAPTERHNTLGLGWRILLAVASIGLGAVLLTRMLARRRRQPPR